MRAEGPRLGRVVGYARVSSTEQALGTSLQDQQNALKSYAKTRGLTVDRVYVEAESAVHEKFERREQIQSLMRDVRRGDLILCDKIDRWSRDPEFTYRSMREIREAGANVFFVGEQLDPSTPEGDTMLNFRVTFAREEHKRIRLRTVGTRKLLRDNGYYVEGLPPIGYKRQLPRGSKGAHKNVLRIEPKDAAIVEDLYRRCIRGASIGDLVDRLKAVHGDRKWDRKQIHHILRNRVYLGEVKDSRGVWIKGLHPPILDVDIFSRAQAAIDSRRLAGPKHGDDSRTSSWLIRNIGVCARCGSKLGAAYGGGTRVNKNYTFYYRCIKKCGARYVPVATNDALVDAMVSDRLVELRARMATEPEDSNGIGKTVDFAARKIQLEAKRERILEAFTDGLMTRDRMHDAVRKVDAATTKLEAEEMRRLRRSPLLDPVIRAEMLTQLKIMKKAWASAPPSVKRETLADLAHVVKLERDKSPVVVWRTVEELAEDVRSEG